MEDIKNTSVFVSEIFEECGDFWTDTALPLLVERLRRFK